MLFSLILLFYITAPNRKLANILFSFITNTHFNPSKQYNINMDIEIDTPKSRLTNISTNNSRVMLVHLYIFYFLCQKNRSLEQKLFLG